MATSDTSKTKAFGNRLAHWLLNAFMLALLGLASAVVFIPRITHAVPLTVLTGSMSPTIRPGDLVIVRPTAVEALHLGDVVTFQPVSGVATLITHRIIEINRNEAGQVTGLQTQGDANNAADKPLVPGQIMGRVWYTVPYIGQFSSGRNSLLIVGTIGLTLIGYALIIVLKKDPVPEPEPAPARGRHLKENLLPQYEAIAGG